MAAYVPTTGRGFHIGLSEAAKSALQTYWPAALACAVFAGTLFAVISMRISGPAAVVMQTSSAQPVNPELAVSGSLVQRKDDFLTVTGEVRNLTSRPLTNVEALTEFFDGSGRLVKAESALIDLPTVRPGEEAPYSVETRDVPGIASCRVRFRHLLGASIPAAIRP